VLIGSLVPAIGVKLTCAVLSAIGVGVLLTYLGTLLFAKEGKVEPLFELESNN